MRFILFSFLLVLLSSCSATTGENATAGENVPPTVRILEPAANSVVSVGTKVDVVAEAVATNSSISSLLFRVDDKQMDVQADMNLQTDAAYTFTFQPETSGARTLTVEAYDGNGASAASSVNVEVTESQPSVDTFAVTVTVLGAGRVSSTPEGLACPGTCTHSFERGTAVSLAAEAAADARFAGWSDGCAGTSCTVSAEAQVTATFESDERREAASVPFTIVALPDTQNYLCYGADGDGCGGKSERFPQLFEAQTQWIADNVSAQDIAFVTHEGDMVDNALNEAEWVDGDRAVDKLDGKVPYSVAIGDHDYGPEEYRDGDTTFYRVYFGAARYENYDWYGGTSPSGLSHYQLFSAGGYDFLHIALEWEAPTSAKTWAKAVLAAHPDLPTIITTHAYLRDGDTSGRSTFTQSCFQPGNPVGSKKCPGSKEGTKDGDASSGQDIFDDLVYPYPQVFMVLGGHFHYNGRRESSCTDGYLACDNGEYRQVSLNKAGSKVYEMLANYQDYANGGDGWLRLLRFVPGGGEDGLDRIEVKTYSPVLDSYQSGDASDFAFDLSFAERFGPQP